MNWIYITSYIKVDSYIHNFVVHLVKVWVHVFLYVLVLFLAKITCIKMDNHHHQNDFQSGPMAVSCFMRECHILTDGSM